MANNKVCLLCLKRFDPLESTPHRGYHARLLSPSSGLDTFTEENRHCHKDLYSRFLHFSSRYLKLQSSDRLLDGIERNDNEESEVIQAFCAKCYEIVSSICDLYAELNTIKTHLVWKLASIRDIISSSKKSVSYKLANGLMKTLSAQLNAGVASLIDLWRKKVAFKCALKVNTSVPRPVIHRGLFPEHWKFTETSTKQVLARLIVVFLLSSSEVKASNQDDNASYVVKKRRHRPDRKRLDVGQNAKKESIIKTEVGGNVDDELTEFDDDPIDAFSSHGGSDSDWSQGPASPAIAMSESDNENVDRSEQQQALNTKRWNFRKAGNRVIKVGEESDSEEETEKDNEPEVKKEIKKTRLKSAKNKDPDKLLSCNKCSKTFHDQRGLSKHLIAIHRVKLSYPCPTCGMKFGRLIDMQAHKRKTHSTGYAFSHRGRPKECKCTQCEEIFPSVKAMVIHRKLKHKKFLRRSRNLAKAIVPGAVNLQCETCNERFESVYVLRKHLERTHEDVKEKLFFCCFCYKSFCKEQTYTLHLGGAHKNVFDKFECDDTNCGETFTGVAELNEHLKTHEHKFIRKDEIELNIQVAGETNDDSKKDNDQLPNEMKIKNEALQNDKTVDCDSDAKTPTKITVKYCPTCNWGFLDDYNLELHVISHIPKINGKFTCAGCNAEYDYIRLLRRHHHRVHGKKSWKCNECNKEFSCRGALHGHIQSHIKMRNDNPNSCFPCTVCQKTFKNANLLRKHSKQHDPANHFSCSECDAKFDIRRRLQIHMKREHGHGEKYPCPVCGMMFIYASYVQCHMRVHQEAAYECDVCHRRFRRGHTLRKHMKTHTSDRVAEFICSECGMAYISDAGLKLHVLAQHTAQELLPFSCPHCPKRYHRKMLMDAHIKTCAKLHGVHVESDKTEASKPKRQRVR